MEPYDDEKIEASHTIIRRINPIQHVVWDKNRDCRRVSSKAFTPSSGENGGMSVDLEAMIVEDGVDPREYVITPDFTGSVAFSADDARALDLWIGCDPLPNNPYHGEVWGSSRPNRFTKTQKKGLQTASTWYVPIGGVEL